MIFSPRSRFPAMTASARSGSPISWTSFITASAPLPPPPGGPPVGGPLRGPDGGDDCGVEVRQRGGGYAGGKGGGVGAVLRVENQVNFYGAGGFRVRPLAVQRV